MLVRDVEKVPSAKKVCLKKFQRYENGALRILLQQAARSSSLESLEIVGCPEIFNELAKIEFSSCLASLKTLEIKHAYNSDSQSTMQFVRALGDLKRLECLTLMNCRLKDEDVAMLAIVLSDPSRVSLKKFNLASNCFTKEGSESLAHVLSNHFSLTELDLSSNELYNIGVASLASALESLSSQTTLTTSLALDRSNTFKLKKLNLCYTFFGRKGAQALARVLPKFTALEELDIGHNFLINIDLVMVLRSIGSLKSLVKLDISSPHYHDDKSACELCKALAEVVCQQPFLKELSILEHNIDYECMAILSPALIQTVSLERFDVSMRRMQARVFALLVQAYMLNQTLQVHGSSQDPLWIWARMPDCRRFWVFFSCGESERSRSACARFAARDGDCAIRRRIFRWLC